MAGYETSSLMPRRDIAGGKSLRSSAGVGLLLLLVLAGAVVSRLPSEASRAARGKLGYLSASAMPLPQADLCPPSGIPAATQDGLRGTDLPPIRYLADPYPTFSDVAVDPVANRAVMTDINRKTVLIYERTSGAASPEITAPKAQIMGPDTMAGFLAGVALDPVRQEIFAVNNDIEDTMAVFSYAQSGDAKPLRALVVPHQSWGVSLASQRQEIALSVQQVNAVFIYRREASGVEPPVRTIQGKDTALADPHGIYVDERHQEILVANHGNWRNEFTEDRPRRINAVSYPDIPPGGTFFPPSISVYPLLADGNAKPIRTIQGPRTGLNYPMAIDVDAARDEIFVANNGDNSVLVFARTQAGNAAPLRILRGARTGLNLPLGIAVDSQNNELWVTNSNEHTAVVFPLEASGDVAPKRVLRTAPADAPLVGFTNPMALSYDTKRDEIIVPN